MICSDIKHNFLIHYLLALGSICITPLIFGISELSEQMSAQPLEMISSVIGIITLTPVFMPEQDRNIRDLVRAKKTSHELVCILRILYSLFVIVLLAGALSVLMKYNDSGVTSRLFASAVSSAFALGSLGCFTASASESSIIGYMVSTAYFLMNLFLRSKLGIFDLFTFSDGNFQVNIWLYISSAILIVSAILAQKIKSR